jgi:hypothetical protein
VGVGRGQEGRLEVVRVVPEAGMVLLFEHDLLHDGEEVAGGVKYTCRTDVLYTRRPPAQQPWARAKRARVEGGAGPSTSTPAEEAGGSGEAGKPGDN